MFLPSVEKTKGDSDLEFHAALPKNDKFNMASSSLVQTQSVIAWVSLVAYKFNISFSWLRNSQFHVCLLHLVGNTSHGASFEHIRFSKRPEGQEYGGHTLF